MFLVLTTSPYTAGLMVDAARYTEDPVSFFFHILETRKEKTTLLHETDARRGLDPAPAGMGCVRGRGVRAGVRAKIVLFFGISARKL